MLNYLRMPDARSIRAGNAFASFRGKLRFLLLAACAAGFCTEWFEPSVDSIPPSPVGEASPHDHGHHDEPCDDDHCLIRKPSPAAVGGGRKPIGLTILAPRPRAAAPLFPPPKR